MLGIIQLKGIKCPKKKKIKFVILFETSTNGA